MTRLDSYNAKLEAALAQLAQCIGVLSGRDMTRPEVMAEESRPILREALAALRGGPRELPAALFDGYAVYQELPQDVRGWTSAENVAAVLDAVVRILRRESSHATSEKT